MHDCIASACTCVVVVQVDTDSTRRLCRAKDGLALYRPNQTWITALNVQESKLLVHVSLPCPASHLSLSLLCYIASIAHEYEQNIKNRLFCITVCSYWLSRSVIAPGSLPNGYSAKFLGPVPQDDKAAILVVNPAW